MSRSYDMQIVVKRFNMQLVNKIIEACNGQWPFKNIGIYQADEDSALIGDAEGNLHYGETEEDFADRIARTVWKANNEYCPVTVRAVYLDELPYEIHERVHKHYQRWLKKAA